MAADLEVLKERYLECQKDNRLLRALLAQNEELDILLGVLRRVFNEPPSVKSVQER